MTWKTQLKGDPLPWLLEEAEPGVRYLALRDLIDGPERENALPAARQAAHRDGPIAAILDNMEPEGFWVTPGPGYNPKYRSTVWAVILLAQLGARIEEDARLKIACDYVLDQALTPLGHFTATGAPSGTADCLQGNLVAALIDLGCRDPRLETAIDWMARSVTGEGVAPAGTRGAELRFYASGNSGPTFSCGANNKLSCAWGGAKVMLALGRVPVEQRTPIMERAIAHGTGFLLSVDPATAAYPSGYSSAPSRNWWKFGFPVFYVTDLLQVVEALLALGHAGDPRLENTLALVLDKQDDQGRWPLEYSYASKTWLDFGAKKKANKWVTLRALRVLQAAASPAAEDCLAGR